MFQILSVIRGIFTPAFLLDHIHLEMAAHTGYNKSYFLELNKHLVFINVLLNLVKNQI